MRVVPLIGATRGKDVSLYMRRVSFPYSASHFHYWAFPWAYLNYLKALLSNACWERSPKPESTLKH